MLQPAGSDDDTEVPDGANHRHNDPLPLACGSLRLGGILLPISSPRVRTPAEHYASSCFDLRLRGGREPVPQEVHNG